MNDVKEACDAVDVAVHRYLEDYQFCGEDEDGHDGTYTPDEYQLMLIRDVIGGLLGDEKFVEVFNIWQDLVRKARPDLEKVSVWERGRQAGAAGAMAGSNPYGVWNTKDRQT